MTMDKHIIKQRLATIVATGFGAGYFPKLPGTIGSLWGVLLFFLFRDEYRVTFDYFLIFLILLAIWSANEAEKVFGQKDCQKIVIDEVVGQLVTYLFVPFSFPNLVVGFALFRFFDVVKIFPSRWIQDRIPGGLGVVGDDFTAGLQAGAILYFLSLLYT